MLSLFYFLTYFTLVNSNITPGNMYDITWNDTESEQINLQLEVHKNGSWVSHKKDDSNFLSVILDGHIGKYGWDIPMELSSDWNSMNRILVSDTKTDDVILNRVFNFYGLDVRKIDDVLMNDTLLIEWNTNINNNLTIKLISEEDIYPLVKNYKEKQYELDLVGYPEGKYFVEIEYNFDLGEIDNIRSSCSDVNCLSLSGSSKSNDFDIMKSMISNDDDDLNDDNSYCFDDKKCLVLFFTLTTLATIFFLYCCLCCLCKSQ